MTTSTFEFLTPKIEITRVVGGVTLRPGDFEPLVPFLDPDTDEPFLDPETGLPFYDVNSFYDGQPKISAGVRAVRDGAGWTTRPKRQRCFVVTDVQFVATMRWRRQVVTVRTPELPAAAEAQPVFWDTDEVLWDTEEVVWQ